MKATAILFALALSLAGPAAFAQTADVSATTAADAAYPAGTLLNGVPISGLDIATGVFITTSGTAEGHISADLFGPVNPLTGKQQIINVEAMATGGTRTAANVTTITGTCTVDMGDGSVPLTNVPFAATITTNSDSQGTVGLVIGATTLPAAQVNAGSMTITEIQD